MWTILSRKTQITIIVIITMAALVSVQSILEWVSGTGTSVFKLVSLIVFLVGTVALWVFNKSWRWLWQKFPAMGGLLFPDLNGTWVGTIQTTWKDPITGVVPGPIDTTVWIKQDLLSISVKQQTKESPSRSTRMFLSSDLETDQYSLWFSYDNRPHANVTHLSPDHEGVCRLTVNLLLDRNLLTGQYYTSRSTSGNMTLKRFADEIKNVPGRKNWTGGGEVNDFRRPVALGL